MTKKENNEILYGMLSQKLYLHYCGEEKDKLSEKELSAILNLMESMKWQLEQDPYFDKDASWERFQERYKENTGVPGELLEAMELDKEVYASRKRRAFRERLAAFCKSKVVHRVALAACAVVIMFVGLNIGTYATSKMGFFEFFSKSKEGFSFFVTGEEEAFGIQETNKNQFETWQEARNASGFEGILIPEYIPENMELDKLRIDDVNEKKLLWSRYNSDAGGKLHINVEYYEKEFSWHNYVNDKEKYVEEEKLGDKMIIRYNIEDEIVVYFFSEKYLYCVNGNIPEDEILKIVEKMQ